MLSELAITPDCQYAANLVKVLISHGYGDTFLIEKLISFTIHNTYHEFRDEVYELITILNLSDKFYNYGLQGLPFLINYNKEIHHGGSEHNLKTFLLSSRNPINILQLLTKFKEDGWTSYFEKNYSSGKEFFKELFEKLADYFNSYPFMIFHIARLIKDLGRRYFRDDFKEVDNFLEKTHSHWLVVRILIDDILKDNNWEIGSLITYDSYDYVFFEFEENNYEDNHLWNCIGGLRRRYKYELADTFYQLCIDATEGIIIHKQDTSLDKLYIENERKKRRNDLIYVTSVEAFKEGLIKYFIAYGKNTISKDNLYVNFENNFGEIRKECDSYFLYYYLIKWHKNTSSVNLHDCLVELDEDGFFEIFQVEEILDYNDRTDETDKVFLPILKRYYDNNLPKANFENCIWIEENCYHYKYTEYRLGEIFKKFNFYTPEEYLVKFIWLDSEGTRGFESAAINKHQSMSQMILGQLSASGKNKLKKEIVQNIKTGIKHTSILGTHISLCRHLKITEARNIILECLKDLKNEQINQRDTVDIYLELGGNSDEILLVLKSHIKYNDYFFYFLTEKLYKLYPSEISLILKESIYCNETNNDSKIRSAQLLSSLGDIEGFSFLVNQVRLNKKSPYHIQGNLFVNDVDTSKALAEISDIMYLLIDKKYDDAKSFHDSAKSIILEWLNTFSLKSENDLMYVISFMENSIEDFKSKYDNASDLNWYINNMLENFRNSDKTVKTISEIKNILIAID
jgi:hypothetical protein